MKRATFVQIIKLRSFWKIDHRRGNYTLPNGKKLITYIENLVESQMKIDDLGILENGDLAFCTGGEWDKDKKEFSDYCLAPAFCENEYCSYDDMEKRIKQLVSEIVG